MMLAFSDPYTFTETNMKEPLIHTTLSHIPAEYQKFINSDQPKDTFWATTGHLAYVKTAWQTYLKDIYSTVGQWDATVLSAHDI